MNENQREKFLAKMCQNLYNQIELETRTGPCKAQEMMELSQDYSYKFLFKDNPVERFELDLKDVKGENDVIFYDNEWIFDRLILYSYVNSIHMKTFLNIIEPKIKHLPIKPACKDEIRKEDYIIREYEMEQIFKQRYSKKVERFESDEKLEFNTTNCKNILSFGIDPKYSSISYDQIEVNAVENIYYAVRNIIFKPGYINQLGPKTIRECDEHYEMRNYQARNDFSYRIKQILQRIESAVETTNDFFFNKGNYIHSRRISTMLQDNERFNIYDYSNHSLLEGVLYYVSEWLEGLVPWRYYEKIVESYKNKDYKQIFIIINCIPAATQYKRRELMHQIFSIVILVNQKHNILAEKILETLLEYLFYDGLYDGKKYLFIKRFILNKLYTRNYKYLPKWMLFMKIDIDERKTNI